MDRLYLRPQMQDSASDIRIFGLSRQILLVLQLPRHMKAENEEALTTKTRFFKPDYVLWAGLSRN
jgi:hypothetical protein